MFLNLLYDVADLVVSFVAVVWSLALVVATAETLFFACFFASCSSFTVFLAFIYLSMFVFSCCLTCFVVSLPGRSSRPSERDEEEFGGGVLG